MSGVPLQLWDRPHWELTGRVASTLFFRHLGDALPMASTLFVEGINIAADVREFFEGVSEIGDYLPGRQTIWPTPRTYRLPFNASVLSTLASLSERHADPELLDHLFVYAGSDALMEFPDAFCPSSPVLASPNTDEPILRAFAEATGLKLVRAF